MATATDERPLQALKVTVSAVLGQSHFKLSTESCRKLQEVGNRLLAVCDVSEHAVVALEFARRLEEELDAILQSCSTCKLQTSKREKAWCLFHSFRCSKALAMWKDFLAKIDVRINAVLIQTITQELFEAKLKTLLHHEPDKTFEVYSEGISEDEKNVLVYACGYVPVRLINRYKKRPGSKYASFVQCLLHMAIGTIEDSFYNYARKWFHGINRGGAFEVGDAAYNFFTTIEKKIRVNLRVLYQPSGEQCRSKVIGSLIEDEDVLFQWSVVCYADTNEDDSIELLRDIIELWMNIRGFSITGKWNEQYKRLCNETSKSKAGLRKDLKKKATDKENMKLTVSKEKSTDSKQEEQQK